MVGYRIVSHVWLWIPRDVRARVVKVINVIGTVWPWCIVRFIMVGLNMDVEGDDRGIVFLAVIVGTIVIAMFMPLISVIQTLGAG